MSRIFEGLQYTPVGKVGRGFDYHNGAGMRIEEADGTLHGTQCGIFHWEAHFVDEQGKTKTIQRVTTMHAAPPDKRAWDGVTYRLGSYDINHFRAFYWRP